MLRPRPEKPNCLYSAENVLNSTKYVQKSVYLRWKYMQKNVHRDIERTILKQLKE